jgi:hypothetical protein
MITTQRAWLFRGGSTLLVLLSIARALAAQILVDSGSGTATNSDSVIAVMIGDSVHSKLGTFIPFLIFQCRHHNSASLSLAAFIAPGITVHHGRYRGVQDVEVQADTGKSLKLNMWVSGRLLIAEYSDEVQKVLLRMTTTRRLAIRWKLWTYEPVVGVFTLDSTLADRQKKLAAPWLSCGNKPLW